MWAYSSILSLDEKPINERKFEDIPEDEQEVVFPPGPRESDTGDESIVKPCDIDPEVIHAHALSARLVAKTLNRVQRLKGREPGSEDEAEDEDDSDFGFSLVWVLSGLIARGVQSDVSGVQCGDEDEDGDDGGDRDEELGPTTPFVGEDGACDGSDEGDDVLEALEEELGVVAGYTGSCEHLRVVVRHGPVAGPLAEEACWRESATLSQRRKVQREIYP